MSFADLASRFALKNLGVLRHLDVFRKLASVKLPDLTEAQVREVGDLLGLPLPTEKLAFGFLLGTLRSGGNITVSALFDDETLITSFVNKFREGMDVQTAAMRSKRLEAAEEIIQLPNFKALTTADIR